MFSFKSDFHFVFLSLFQKATVEAVKELIKKHEEFEKRMNANDDKINQMMQFADRLNEENHYASDKITEKARSIDERQVTKIHSFRPPARSSVHRSFRPSMHKSQRSFVFIFKSLSDKKLLLKWRKF